jgi:hypothetical protein
VRGAHLALDFFRKPFVVVVEESDPFTAGSTNAGVAGIGAAAAFGEVDYAQTRVMDGFQVFACRLIGAIDDDDNFQLPPRLAERAANRAGEQVGPVTRWNNSGDKRSVRVCVVIGHDAGTVAWDNW